MKRYVMWLVFGIAVAFAGAAALLAPPAPVAYADGGPHGGYRDVSAGLPSQCAGCHREHQGKSVGKLLKASSPYALCLTCHNGAGSRLDVLDGAKLGSTIAVSGSVVGFAENPTLGVSLSLAPYAHLAAPPGVVATTRTTVAVRNSSGGPVTLSLTLADAPSAAPAFTTPSLIKDMSGTVITSIGPISSGNTDYFQVEMSSTAASVSGDLNLVTITGTNGPNNVAAVAEMRVETNPGNVLNGGGFVFMGGVPVTSKHNEDPAENNLAPWGYNLNNTGQQGGAGNLLTSMLQCTSCHNPHGTSNYRILNEKVNGNTVNVKAWYPDAGGAAVANEGARGLETGAPADKYTKEYYASAGTGGAPTTGEGSLASLCGSCHTAYPSSGATLAYVMGGVTHYRHKTEMPYTDWTHPGLGTAVPNNPETAPIAGFPALRLASNAGNSQAIVTCLTCHRVHGTNATMSGYALKGTLGGLADEDLSPAQTTGSRSTLLYTNNRGMCEACHQW